MIAALVAVYIVLGILYESYIHPITILSTLPSAGVGALLALMITGTDLSVIALIGIILLIGIVKKNAIMMIDFALGAERNEGKSPEDAIFQACLLRFRPITMTTMAALFGALAAGAGHRQRRRAAPPAGHCHRRWADFQPDADALYDAGHLPLSRPAAPLAGGGPSWAFAFNCRYCGRTVESTSSYSGKGFMTRMWRTYRQDNHRFVPTGTAQLAARAGSFSFWRLPRRRDALISRRKFPTIERCLKAPRPRRCGSITRTEKN